MQKGIPNKFIGYVDTAGPAMTIWEPQTVQPFHFTTSFLNNVDKF